MRNCFLSPVTTLVTLALAICFASELTAGGLSTNLGEVIIAGLEKGEKYSLKKLANVTLSVVNRGEDTVTVRICALVPDSVELRQGAAPIPSTDWVSLEADSFVLAPGQMGVSDVFIEIPDDSALAGRKFQVMLWSRTIPGPGVFMACGLKSRMIFSLADAGSVDNAEGADGAVKVDSAGNSKNKKDDTRADAGTQKSAQKSLEPK
jgi:hypothetical protein